MTPKYTGGDNCSIKFGTTYELRERFAFACAKAGISQTQALKAMVLAWIEEVEASE
jgi:hypothetical protein